MYNKYHCCKNDRFIPEIYFRLTCRRAASYDVEIINNNDSDVVKIKKTQDMFVEYLKYNFRNAFPLREGCTFSIIL